MTGAREPGTARPDLGDPAGRREPDGVVTLSSVPWDYLRIAPQQTLRALCRRLPVLYVERGSSVARGLLEPRVFASELGRIRRGLWQAEPDLHVIAPLPFPPWCARSVMAARLSACLMGMAAREGMRRLGMRRPAVIAYLPQFCFLQGTLGESVFAYDVIDEYSAFPGVSSRAASTLEAMALARADLVFAISETLVADRRPVRPDVRWLPVGAETAHFLSPPAAPPLAPELADLPRPWIGYYGGIDDRVDVDLCREAARALPEASFLYYGPVRSERFRAAMGTLPNVRLPGPLAYEVLPTRAREFDVCILPYTPSRFNRSIFPNKIYEYLATGRPVVSTPIPALGSLVSRGLVSEAEGAVAFVAAIRAALAGGEAGRSERQEEAARNTWEGRAERMWADILAFVRRSGSPPASPGQDVPRSALTS